MASHKIITARNRIAAFVSSRQMSSEITKKPPSDKGQDDPFDGQTTINRNHDGVGFKQSENSPNLYLNPLLTPPPRSPRTPEDFKQPMRLGHWISHGFNWENPIQDRYYYHEMMFFFVFSVLVGGWCYYYVPDLKYSEWARREAYLRTAKREALGLPLIDKNVVPPERIVLPTEEELEGFDVFM